MPVGTISARYALQQAVLKAHAAACALAATGSLARAWYVPDGGGAWLGDPQDIAGLASAFDRSEEAATYSAALLTPAGSGGDAMSMKVQHDYQALQERAYRARHLGPVRAVLHAGARRAGHGTAVHGAFDRVTQFAADLLVAGAAGWQAPQAPVS